MPSPSREAEGAIANPPLLRQSECNNYRALKIMLSLPLDTAAEHLFLGKKKKKNKKKKKTWRGVRVRGRTHRAGLGGGLGELDTLNLHDAVPGVKRAREWREWERSIVSLRVIVVAHERNGGGGVPLACVWWLPKGGNKKTHNGSWILLFLALVKRGRGGGLLWDVLTRS